MPRLPDGMLECIAYAWHKTVIPFFLVYCHAHFHDSHTPPPTKEELFACADASMRPLFDVFLAVVENHLVLADTHSRSELETLYSKNSDRKIENAFYMGNIQQYFYLFKGLMSADPAKKFTEIDHLNEFQVKLLGNTYHLCVAFMRYSEIVFAKLDKTLKEIYHGSPFKNYIRQFKALFAKFRELHDSGAATKVLPNTVFVPYYANHGEHIEYAGYVIEEPDKVLACQFKIEQELKRVHFEDSFDDDDSPAGGAGGPAGGAGGGAGGPAGGAGGPAGGAGGPADGVDRT